MHSSISWLLALMMTLASCIQLLSLYLLLLVLQSSLFSYTTSGWTAKFVKLPLPF